MNETADNLRAQIRQLVREYHKAAFPAQSFNAGKSPVLYAGRVFDDKELVNLVDSGLDFW